MKRHFYITNDLQEMHRVQEDLEASGVTTPQIHVLSNDDVECEKNELNDVDSLLKKDVIHSTEVGFLVGMVVAVAILVSAHLSGVTEYITWVPPLFLSVVIIGFCSWEGGLIGIQAPHHDFRKFQSELASGNHVMLVDVNDRQESVLENVMGMHPKLHVAGVGEAAPGWILSLQRRFQQFVHWAP
ncbi:NAD/FAD-utilizing enzyme [Marinibactrum halimedae]|uniref:NAD/FAD-utilizing enzyme n=1 Tax=Marinibactrum halimedae TaxID=1444977 RepID=A0AA37WP72_9GAMM|nr:NAD/FAD-utilizing enzyme [Marinibactrum halimedae]MCD9459345.1 NAD/FAD-utilizing enzyme [Marinibactrum halimedae]GLS25762.1 hypothetical protein GCM10007877_14760 [Marinibactrum halimedae]